MAQPSSSSSAEPTEVAEIMGIRKSYSCIPCRNRKVKCDKQVPCKICIKRGDQCTWTINSQPMLAAAAAAGTPSQPTPGPSGDRAPDPPKDVATGEVWDHAILLNKPARQGSIGGASNLNVKGKAKVGEAEERRLVVERLLERLPDQMYCDSLLHIYLTRVEWIHHPLHVPEFLKKYNDFWLRSPKQRIETTSPIRLALLFIVLCLGMHFSDVPLAKTLNHAGEVVTVESLHSSRSQACQAALEADNYMQNHSLEAIQTCICLGLYLNDRDLSATGDVMMAIAIKIAISMGLSRIPAENALVKDGTMEREMGRRLWWSLVCQDAYTASACGFTTLINLNHASTGMYSNINDEDLVEGKPIVAKDREIITISSYHLFQVPFALTVRKFIDAINASFPNPSYKSILDLDRQYRETYESLPHALRPDLPQPFTSTPLNEHLVYQRVFMGITLNNRIIRLHRAFMLRGYTNDRYKYSTAACLKSAHTLLELVANSRTGLARWWVVLVHIWTSGLVISVDLYQCEEEEGHELVLGKRAGIELATSLLKPAMQSSSVAQRAVKILDQIISQDKINRQKKKRKRKRSEVPDLSGDAEETPEDSKATDEVPLVQVFPSFPHETNGSQTDFMFPAAEMVFDPSFNAQIDFGSTTGNGTVDYREGSVTQALSPTMDMWDSLLDTDLANIGQFDFGSYNVFDDPNEGFDRANYW